MKPSRVVPVILVVFMVSALVAPASATHEPVQSVSSGSGGTDEVWVGLASDGLGTAVWTENGGIFTATRPAGGGFAAGTKIPVSEGADQVTFHQAPNGNAVVAWTSGAEGDLMASVRIGTSGSFGSGQVLAPTSATGVAFADSSISDAGRAAVVWQETNTQGQTEIKAALSSSSGAFAAPQTLATDRVLNPRVDMSDAGDVIAVWDLQPVEGIDEIQFATAPRDGAFGSMGTMASLEQGPGRPDVAVNAGANAVVAWADFTSVAQGGSSRDVIEVRYGSTSGQFGAEQVLTDVDNPTAAGEIEVAVDNAGRAAVVFVAHMDASYGLFGAVSDATGQFGTHQTISHAGTSAGNLVGRSFEVAAGGGEFTAFWANDPDGNGVDGAFNATTSGGVFQTPHEVSPASANQMTRSHGARNPSGDTLSAWVEQATYHLARVAPATAPEAPSGTDGDDQLSGTSGADIMFLKAGDDIYNALGGNDSVYGEAGDDQIAGGKGIDLLVGGADHDSLIGGAGDDTLKGGSGNDTLTGDGVNAITGSVGSRPYLATSGNDILVGGGGRDKLIGGAGFDRFNGGPGKDVCIVDSRKEKRRARGCETIRLRRSR